MPDVQLRNHLADDVGQVGAVRDVFDQRLVLLPDRGPIDAVQARVVKEVAHLPPALAEHLLPLGLAVEVHLQPRDVQRLAERDGRAGQVDDRVLAVLRDEHLLPVGGNLVPADRPEPGFLPRAEVEHVQLRRAAMPET